VLDFFAPLSISNCLSHEEVGDIQKVRGNRATGQPAKAAAELSRFHPITVVVSPRRDGGDPAKPLFYPRHDSGISKRLSFHADAAAAGRQKRFYHPDAAATAPNDGRFTRTSRRQAGKTAFSTPMQRRQAKTTVVMPENCRHSLGNHLFSAGCTTFTHFSETPNPDVSRPFY
jgi:hypothetical protein